MSDLLRADFYRAKKDIILFIALILVVFFALSTPALYLLLEKLIKDSLSEIGGAGLGISFSGKFVFMSTLSVTNNIGLILPVLIGILVCRDFSTGTVRNKIIAGHSRLQVYLSLLISAVSIGATLFLIYSLLMLALGSLLLGYGSAFTFGEFIYILKVLLMGTLMFSAMISIGIFFAAATRSIGITIVLQIALGMVIAILGSIPMMLIDCPEWLEQITRLNPAYQLNLLTASENLPTDLFITSLLSSAAYIIISAAAGSLILRRAELK